MRKHFSEWYRVTISTKNLVPGQIGYRLGPEIREWIGQNIGDFHETMGTQWEWDFIYATRMIMVRFKEEEHALLFKLYWGGE